MDVDGIVASLKKAKTKPDREAQIKAAAASGKAMKCQQLVAVLNALPLPSEKEAAVIALYPCLTDREYFEKTVLPPLTLGGRNTVLKAIGHDGAQGSRGVATQPLDVDTLAATLKKTNAKPARDAQIKAVATSGKTLSCAQLATLLKTLPLPSEKEAAIIALYPCLTDKEALEKGDVMAGLNPNNKNNVLKAIGR